MTIMTMLSRVGRMVFYLGVVFLVALAAGAPAPLRQSVDVPGRSVGSPPIILGGDGAAFQTRVLHVGGEPAEMGYQIGYQLRQEIRDAIFVALQMCAIEHGSGCLARAERLRASLSPALLEEVQGIARGAEVSEADVLLLNSLSDRLFEDDTEADCAAFAAWDAATIDGAALIGGVWGRNGHTEPLWIARQPAGENATFLLALPGWVGGMAGINDSGVSAFSLSVQTADTAAEGAPATIVLREALAGSADPEEAIERVVAQRHHAGAQMWFASAQNGVQGVEFTARLLRMLQPDVNTFASVGLYAHSRLVETQLFDSSPDAFTILNERWRAMESTVRTNVGWIGVEKALAMLRGMASDGDGMLLLMDPTAETIWFGVAEGHGAGLLTFQPFELLTE